MSVSADFTNWRSDAPLAEATNRRSEPPLAKITLPWQGVALLVCMVILPVVAAVFFPAVFATPLQQF